MHSESEIRSAIKPLVEFYGEMTTSEVKQHLEEVLDYDDDDRIPSETRNEILITQRIGNIVAHQRDTVKVYSEGFIVDKSFTPAHFFAIKGLSGHEQKLPENEIKKRQQKAKQKHIYKKVNWELENERRSLIGHLGEEFVYHSEIAKVKEFDASSLDKVIHLSEKQGDGFGYDICSVNENGETIFIEVKTTKGTAETPFFMSRNEKLFFEENIDNNAFIYRVFNFNEESRHGQIKIISAKDLLKNYKFDPISFMVTHK